MAVVLLIQEHIPAKQGLKLNYSINDLIEKNYSGTHSSKTRIETIEVLHIVGEESRYSGTHSSKTRIETKFHNHY